MSSEIHSESLVHSIETRRSIRLFEPIPVPTEVIHKALELALLAPNSSNLQPWEFFWVTQPEKKMKLVEFCMSQAAAATAAELVVCVARTDTWKRNLEYLKGQLKTAEAQGTRIPKAAWQYYNHLAPLMYDQGPFGIWGPFKKLISFLMGLSKPIAREPHGTNAMKLWATKTTALACENFMVAIRSFGFDTCPMEGIDSRRIRKLLNLPRHALVPMVIAIGKRRPEGVTLPRLRVPRDWVIHTV